MKSLTQSNYQLMVSMAAGLVGFAIAFPCEAQVGELPIVNESAELSPSDPEDAGSFGYAVATNGEETLVGHPYDVYAGDVESSVFSFIRGLENDWIRSAVVVPSDPTEKMYFGESIAIDNEFAVIGAWNDQSHTFGHGSAYIFEKTGNDIWVERAKLVGHSAKAQLFGRAVAISGDTAVVDSANYVYVFTRDGNSWPLTQVLDTGTARPRDFGSSVAISGDVLAVRAGVEPNSSAYFLAYVYRKTAKGLWALSDRLSSPDAQTDSVAGDLDTDGHRIAFGDRSDDTRGHYAGAAFIYRREGLDSWVEEAKLLPPYKGAELPALVEFGSRVAIEGNIAVICERRGKRPLGGDAIVYQLNDEGIWEPIALLYPSAPSSAGFFDDLDFEESTVVIGSTYPGGGAYVYELESLGIGRGVAIDVKPYDKRNAVDPDSPVLFSVAILSNAGFDALQTDLQTIRLEPGDARARNYRIYDANRDRIPDLAPLFRARDLLIGCGETEVELTGRTHDGVDFYGTDVVTNRRCPK